MSRTAFLTAGLVLLAAAPAQAATARVAGDGVLYTAAPGERNALTTSESPGVLVLRDAGAPITPGSGCAAVEGGVTCHVPNAHGLAPGLDAYLGDGDDRYKGTSRLDRVRGGSGDDTLSGDGTLWGGPGEDLVEGTFRIHDDDGATPARDVYRGGGQALLTYEDRQRGVRVDLRGGSSEDAISGVRSVHGSRADDVLLGDDAANGFHGGGGHDVLRGLGGDDILSSSSGTAEIDCGAGRDVVRTGRRGAVVARCEVANSARVTAALDQAGAAFASIRPAICIEGGCNRPTEVWTAKARGRSVGGVDVEAGPVELRLNAAGRRVLRREGTLTVTLRRALQREGRPARLADAFTVEVRLAT